MCFVFVLFFITPKLLGAQVVINEVQLSPVGERFVELYNQSDEDVDLTGWYIQRKTSVDGDNLSLVSKTKLENKTIGANSFFIISKNDGDVVLDTFTLGDSNILQIRNGTKEEDIKDVISWGGLSNCNTICESDLIKKYEGKSLQRFGPSWSVADPTPGKSNVLNNTNNTNNSNTSNNNTNTQNSSTSLTTDVKKKEKIIYDVKTYLNVPEFAFVGIPIKLSAHTTGRDGGKSFYGKYFWNFGDGSFVQGEIKDVSDLEHIYYYSGEYEINLNFYEPFSEIDKPNTTNTFNIKVVPVELEVKNIKEDNNLFIEIVNNSSYPLDISSWYLRGGGKTFVFPLGTKIKAKSKIVIPPQISLFNISLYDKVFLFDKEGINRSFEKENNNNIVSITPKQQIFVNANNLHQSQNTHQNNNIQNTKNPDLFSENNQNLSANVLNNPTIEKNKNKSWIYVVFFLLLIGVAFGIYFIRIWQRKNSKETQEKTEDGSDFDILDE